MGNKKTIRDYFNDVIEMAKANDRQDLVEFAEGRIAVLDKKAANKKPTKVQQENEVIRKEILNTLTEEGMTVTEVMKKSEVLGSLSNQKVSALLRQLVNEEVVVKTTDKKKSYFSLAPIEVEED